MSFRKAGPKQAQFRLGVPVGDALAFAMAWSNLKSVEPSDSMRRIMGMFALDRLEYDEQWREAAVARACLAAKWPGWF